MKVFLSLGDLSAANYIHAIFGEGFEDVELIGITDARLESIGVRRVASVEEVSVVGIMEVLPRIPKVIRVLRKVRDSLRGCDVLIACDAPSFNFRVIRMARGLGVRRVVYFISPQVWAWRSGRAKTIADLCDHLVVILPFEVDIYRPFEGRSFRVHYVGHPLVDLVRPGCSPEELRKKIGVKGDFLNLMPGSRWSELRKHIPLLKAVLESLQVSAVVPTFPSYRRFIEKNLSGARVITEEEAPLPAYSSMFYSRCSLIASGTASLEASLAGSPHLVFYRVNPITLWVGRKIVKVPHISLPNILLQRKVVPELINPSPENLLRETLNLWEKDSVRRVQREAFSEIRRLLGEEGVVERLRNLFRDLLSF